jgi:hypothetical protein
LKEFNFHALSAKISLFNEISIDAVARWIVSISKPRKRIWNETKSKFLLDATMQPPLKDAFAKI